MSTENWSQLLSPNSTTLMNIADRERSALGDYLIQTDHLVLAIIHRFTLESLGDITRDRTRLLVEARRYLSRVYSPPANASQFPVEYSQGFQEVIHEARQQLVGLPYPSLIPHLIINALFNRSQGYAANLIRDFGLRSKDYPGYPYRGLADILTDNLNGYEEQQQARRRIYRFVTH